MRLAARGWHGVVALIGLVGLGRLSDTLLHYVVPILTDLRIIDPLEVLTNCVFIGAIFVGFGFAVLQIDNRLKPLFSKEYSDV